MPKALEALALIAACHCIPINHNELAISTSSCSQLSQSQRQAHQPSSRPFCSCMGLGCWSYYMDMCASSTSSQHDPNERVYGVAGPPWATCCAKSSGPCIRSTTTKTPSSRCISKCISCCLAHPSALCAVLAACLTITVLLSSLLLSLLLSTHCLSYDWFE